MFIGMIHIQQIYIYGKVTSQYVNPKIFNKRLIQY